MKSITVEGAVPQPMPASQHIGVVATSGYGFQQMGWSE